MPREMSASTSDIRITGVVSASFVKVFNTSLKPTVTFLVDGICQIQIVCHLWRQTLVDCVSGPHQLVKFLIATQMSALAPILQGWEAGQLCQ